MTIARTLSQVILSTTSPTNFPTLAAGTTTTGASASTLSTSAGNVRIAPPSNSNIDLAVSGSGQVLFVAGTATTPSLVLGSSTNTGLFSGATNQVSVAANGLEALRIIPTASSVNFLQIAPAATTTGPTFSAAGTDTNVDLNLAAKGTGSVKINSTAVATVTQTQETPYIIGGDFTMNPWQRGSSFIGTAYTNGPDRWVLVRGSLAAGYTLSKQGSLASPILASDPSFPIVARMQRDSGNTGVGQIWLCHVMESANAIRLAGRKVTFSIRGRKSAGVSAGTCTANLYTGTQINATAQSFIDPDPVAHTAGVALQASLDLTTFDTVVNTTLSATVTLPTNMKQIFVLITYIPTGTASSTDFYDFAAVQLDDGLFNGFVRRDAGSTLRDCQRYCISYAQTVSGNQIVFFGQSYTATNAFYAVLFPTTMRAPPTMSFSALAHFYCSNAANSLFTAPTAISNSVLSATNATINCTEGAGYFTVGSASAFVSNSTSALLIFSAEL